MWKLFFTCLRLFLWLVLVTGIIYPFLITSFAALAFNHKANGQLVVSKGKTVGSKLIGQHFSSDKYFWSRPSAVDYNPLPSGGSNLGPTSAELKKTVEIRKKLILEKHVNQTEIPIELLYASGSGLDPHINPLTARYQIDRIIKARGLDSEIGRKQLLELIEKNRQTRKFGLFGAPTVNVLQLNIALDEQF